MDHATKFKLVAGVVVWLQAIVGGLAPLVLKDRVSPVITSVLNMFAAGIFLAASCLHLLPDAQENEALRAAGCYDHGRCIQLANFFYGVGFLAVTMLEVFAHAIHKQYSGREPHAASERTPLVFTVSPAYSSVVPDVTAPKLDQTRHPIDSSASFDTNDAVSPHLHKTSDANPVLTLIVLTALSFHSVMEGMGIGAASGAAWDILVAIIAHKSLAAFTLALELLHHEVPQSRFIVTIAIFSVMSPLGILFGWLLVGAHHDSAASGICTALAGGTFLYVAVMETIPQELRDHKQLVPKCTALMVGFVSMALLSVWT